jgi:hypothetical protein
MFRSKTNAFWGTLWFCLHKQDCEINFFYCGSQLDWVPLSFLYRMERVYSERLENKPMKYFANTES